MVQKHGALPYDDPLGEPLDGRDSQPMESGDQDYPETLDMEDPLRAQELELDERGMHIEDDDDLGFEESLVGLDDDESDDNDADD